jgi:hypothetical protein
MVGYGDSFEQGVPYVFEIPSGGSDTVHQVGDILTLPRRNDDAFRRSVQ